MTDDEEWHVHPSGLAVKGKHHPCIVDGVDTVTGQPAEVPGNAERPYWDDPAIKAHRDELRAARREMARKPDGFARRRQLMDRVIGDQQQPRLKPFLVEQQILAELGPEFGSFAQSIQPTDADALVREGWPWHVACCWIMTQEPQQALLAVCGFAVWQGCTVRDDCRPGHVMSFAQASAVLRRALIRGEVRAKRDDGALAQEIPAEEWPRLSWPVVDGETRSFDVLLRDGVPVYEKPVIVAANVVQRQWTIDGSELRSERELEQTKEWTPVNVEKENRNKLVAMMKANRDDPESKERVKADHFPNVGPRAWARIWTAAVQEADAPKWSKAGPRPKGKRLQSPRS